MRILSWNCRGLSNPRAISNLKKLAQQHQPDVLFLSETLSNAQKLEPIRVLLNFDSCLSVDVVGRSWGLAVLWKEGASCNIVNYTRHFVNILVQDKMKGVWRLTCYYGYPERSRRKDAWDMLRDLRDMSVIPSCVIGDFNDLLSQQDKLGIHQHPNWLCVGFREVVSDCNLIGMPLEGHLFTWIKSRGTPHVVEERLDHALVSFDWLDIFPNANLVNLLATHSNHNPILLHCDPVHQRHKNFAFKFENMWLRKEELGDVVWKGWNRDNGGDVLQQIKNYAGELSTWNRVCYTQKRERLSMHMAVMEATRLSHDEAAASRFIEDQREYNEILTREEIF